MSDPLHSSEIDRELNNPLDGDDSASECGSDGSYFTPPVSDSGGTDSDIDSVDENTFRSSHININSTTNTSVEFMDLELEDPPLFLQNVTLEESGLEPIDDHRPNFAKPHDNLPDDNQHSDNLSDEDENQPNNDQSVDARPELTSDNHTMDENNPVPPGTSLRGRGQRRSRSVNRQPAIRGKRNKRNLPEDSTWTVFQGLQQNFQFSRSPKCNVNMPKDSKPIEYYNLMVNDEVIQLMVTETNRNAEQTLANRRLSRRSRLRNWKETDAVEMRKFLGLIIWMGLSSCPRISDYWSTSILYKNSVAPNVMSRNRFQLLLRFWHFNDNQNPEEPGRLSKIAPLINLLNKVFKNLKTAEEELAIDETMVPFRGRLVFRQFLPKKANKYGVKLFKLCDSKAYTYTIKVYSGKGSNVTPDLLMGTSVVLELLEPYLNSGSTLYVDNYYCSIELAKRLLQKETHLVGTLRSDRAGLPKELIFGEQLKRGEMVVAENKDGIVITNWQDKRRVLMLSTKHKVDMVDTGKTDRKKNKVFKPLVVFKYNELKMGIDVADQMASYNSAVRKPLRWYHKVAEHILFGSCVVNAWLIYKGNHGPIPKCMGITTFKENIALDLMGLKDDMPRTTAPGQHYLKETEVFVGVGKNKRRQRKMCKICYKKNSQSDGRRSSKDKAKITTFCEKCPGQPFMCKGCFIETHK